MKPERIVHEIFTKRRLTLAVAESCAGGLISNRITDIPGSSAYFKGAVVAYSNEAKTALLKVPKSLMIKHGAVSPETAAAMALGGRRVFGADAAVAVTGISGPSGGTSKKPVGLAYIGVAIGKELEVKKVNFKGSRVFLKRRFADAALKMLVERINQTEAI